MSYIEDSGVDVVVMQEIADAVKSLENGVCANCGSHNIKRSKAGNLYCAELCWVADPTP